MHPKVLFLPWILNFPQIYPMRLIKRVLLVLVILAVLLSAGVYVFLQTTRPTYSGQISLPGLKAEVDVFYDDFGVPHIYAGH